jgi:hypothetical protein
LVLKLAVSVCVCLGLFWLFSLLFDEEEEEKEEPLNLKLSSLIYLKEKRTRKSLSPIKFIK